METAPIHIKSKFLHGRWIKNAVPGIPVLCRRLTRKFPQFHCRSRSALHRLAALSTPSKMPNAHLRAKTLPAHQPGAR